MLVPVKRSDSWRAWSRLLVQGCDLRQWCSQALLTLSLASCPYLSPRHTPLFPRPQSLLYICRLTGNESQSLTCRTIIRHKWIDQGLQQLSTRRELPQEVGRWAEADTFFCSRTGRAVSWGLKERRKGRHDEGGRLTGLGDSVLPQQHSQKRCGSDVCVRACVTSTV